MANPYINRYKKYLQREERQRQSYLSKRRRNQILGTVAVGVGLATATHLAHPRGVVGALEDVGRYAGATVSASSSALDRVGGIRAFTEPLRFRGLNIGGYVSDIDRFQRKTFPRRGQVISEMKDTFNKRFKEYLSESSEIDIDRLRRESTETVEELGFQYRRSLVHQQVNESLTKYASKSDTAANQISQMQKDMGHRLANLAFESRSNARNKLMETGMSEGMANDMIRLLRDARENVNEFMKKQDMDSFRDEVQQTVLDEIIRERQDQVTRGVGKRVGRGLRGLSESAFGYKKATLSDIESLEATTGVNVTEDTRDFLNQLRRAGADPDKFIPDDNILVFNGKLISATNIHKQLQSMRNVFSEGLLGHLLYQRDAQLANHYSRKAAVYMRSGYHNFGLADTDVIGKDFRLKETLLGIGDTAYRIQSDGKNLSLQPVKSGLEFTSGRFASIQRLMAQMSGVNAPEWDREGAPWWESKLFDISAQRQPGLWNKLTSAVRKKRNPEWLPNKFNIFLNTLASTNAVPDIQTARQLHRYITETAPAMPDRLMENLAGGIDDLNINLSTNEGLIDAYVQLAKRTGDINYSDDILRGKALGLLNRKRVIQNRGVFTGNKLQEGSEIIRKHISRMLIKERGVANTLEIANKMFDQGDLLIGQRKNISKAITDYTVDEAFMLADDQFTEPIRNVFRGESIYGNRIFKDINDMLSSTHPKSGYGPVEGYTNYYHGDILALNKVTIHNFFDTFTAGRTNMGDVHKGTLFTYGMLSRMNELVRNLDVLPLSLTDESMGSSGAIIKNAFFKRIMPIYAGIEAFKWVNDYSKELTGYTLEQREERAKAHTRFKMAGIKDSLGITSLLKQLDLATPGSEGLETFIREAPLTGPTAPLAVAGKMLDWTGIGSTKSYKDWTEYYLYGEDPIRKSRYWIMGSTPWMGEGITHFRPNSYKLAMSEWRYTDTVYGSRENYWAHSFLPTPSHPFAPIRRYITDRYWWEKMHRKDRPYPISGGLFDPDTPWGMIGNITVGRFIKPGKDYNAGATETNRERLDRQGSYPSFTIARYTKGDLHLAEYTPHIAITGAKRSQDEIETINTGIIAKGKVARARSMLTADRSSQVSRAISTGSSVTGAEGGNIYVGDTNGVRTVQVASEGMAYISENEVGEAQLVSSGNAYAMDSITAINNTIKAKGQAIKAINAKLSDTGVVTSYKAPFADDSLDLEIQDPSSLKYQTGRALEIFAEGPGARTFLAQTVLGGDDYGEGTAVYERAGEGYHWSARFRGMELGGRGGAISEVARRLWTKKPGLAKSVNNIPNMMPGWMPEYMRRGDPYRKVPGGEYRMPGEAYESLHRLHPDKFGKYGAVDRAAILADVAPWSKEYKFWLKIARSQDLTPEEEDFLKRSLEQTREQTEKYHFTPYKFIDNNLQKKTVEIDKFVDQNRFKIKGSDQTFRLAGVYNSFSSDTPNGLASLRVLEEHMLPGSKITMVYAKFDHQGTAPAVVYHDRVNVNQLLLKEGVKSREESGPISTYVNMNFLSRGIGYAWETVAHSQIPFVQNKVLNVKSPLEHYKDRNLYGKEWQSWQEPIEDFIIPDFQASIARHPLGAGLSGAGVGAAAGWILGGPKLAKGVAAIGAMVATGGSIGRMAYETSTGKAWIPERRLKERDINAYFDRLKYLKYKRLYNKYLELAKRKEGVDLEEIIERLDKIDNQITAQEKRIESAVNLAKRTGYYNGSPVKRVINSQGRLEYKMVSDPEYLSNLKQKLGSKVDKLKEKEFLVGLGPYAQRAIEYRQEYKSTLYGLGEDVTAESVMRALPVKSRPYFEKFVNVKDPEERKEILKLVPENERRAYQMLWGMNVDDKESMEEFFSSHYLPNEDWIGWKEGIDLEDAQIKTIENQGLDSKDFGIWKDFTEQERLTPAPAQASIGYDNANLSPGAIRREIHDILSEYDLEEIDIKIEPTNKLGINIDFRVRQDRRQEIQEKIVNVLGA